MRYGNHNARLRPRSHGTVTSHTPYLCLPTIQAIHIPVPIFRIQKIGAECAEIRFDILGENWGKLLFRGVGRR